MKLGYLFGLLTTAGLALPLYARQVTVTASVNTSYVNEETETSATSSTKQDTYSVQPSVAAKFQGGRFKGNLNARHRQLDRHASSNTATTDTATETRDSYTTYTANTEFELLENALYLTLNGSQTYQSFDINDSLTDDEFNDDGSLSKTQRTQIGFRFKSPQADYLAIELNARLSELTSENQDQDDFAVDSRDKNLTSKLTSGDRMDDVTWDILSTFRESEGRTNTDLTSIRHTGNVYFGLYDELSFLLTGRFESNDRTSTTDTVSDDLDYNSYGAGLSWGKEQRRRINLTYNVSDNSDQEKQNFVGLDVNWAFTPRTSVRAELSRRYFGESGSFSLRHNSRRIRTSVTYSEDLTTFSQIVGSELNEESFVCPTGAIDFAECFQPPTLDYDLKAGEEFTSFFELNPIISEEVRLRKALQGSIGYDFRRLKTTLNLRRTTTDFLDSGREQSSELIGINANLKAGQKTSFTTSVNFQRTDDEQDLLLTETELWTVNLGVNRTVGRHSRLRISYRHIERQTDDAEKLGENRLTVSFNYRFK